MITHIWDYWKEEELNTTLNRSEYLTFCGDWVPPTTTLEVSCVRVMERDTVPEQQLCAACVLTLFTSQKQ